MSNSESRFKQALKFALEFEGGFVNDPDDPGGATNMGVTLRTLKDAGVDIDGDGDTDIYDVRNLTLEHVVPIYKERYWDVLRLDEEEDWQFAIAQFDCAVNCGPSRTRRWRDTVKKTEGVKNKAKGLNNLRRIHYANIIQRNPVLGKYRNGWNRRVNELEKYLEVLGQED